MSTGELLSTVFRHCPRSCRVYITDLASEIHPLLLHIRRGVFLRASPTRKERTLSVCGEARNFGRTAMRKLFAHGSGRERQRVVMSMQARTSPPRMALCVRWVFSPVVVVGLVAVHIVAAALAPSFSCPGSSVPFCPPSAQTRDAQKRARIHRLPHTQLHHHSFTLSPDDHYSLPSFTITEKFTEKDHRLLEIHPKNIARDSIENRGDPSSTYLPWGAQASSLLG